MIYINNILIPFPTILSCIKQQRICIFSSDLEKLPPDIQAKLVAVKEDLSLSDDDTLNWKAFLAATIDKNLVMREDKIRFAFDHFFHSENKDYLTLADFESIFDGDTQGKELFNFLDTNGDGKVSYDDFRVAMEECIDIDDDK